MAEHAYLSASGADRWMRCAAAPRLEEQFPDERSPFAAEGTTAHQLAEECLTEGIHASDHPGDHDQYPEDMRRHVQTYLDYVHDVIARAVLAADVAEGEEDTDHG